MNSCQHCHQPLFPLEDSFLSPLSPSAYDFISSSTLSTAAPPAPARYAPPPSFPAGINPNKRATLPVVRVPNPYSPTRAQGGTEPGDSFVVLTESVVRPARAASLSEQYGPALSALPAVPPPPPAETPSTTPLTPHLANLHNLYSILSSNTTIDHPLCEECMQALNGLMDKEMEEGRRERDRLIAFERDVVRKKEDAKKAGTGLTKEGLLKDIAKLQKSEKVAVEDLKSLELAREVQEKEKAELDQEEVELAKEEEEFWKEYSKYLLEAAALKDKTNSLQMRLNHDARELEKLAKTNVYNDAFCIGQESGFGTINGLRFGRLPGTTVEWPEINAAWGHTLLLLHTIARKFAFEFDSYRLVPMGSFSRIEKVTGDKAIYELYGSGDFAVARILQNRRFDMAMVAFLDCLRQVMEFVKMNDRSLKLPHAVVKDKIGDVSIKLQFGSDETWTRALRHVLIDLKVLLGRASSS